MRPADPAHRAFADVPADPLAYERCELAVPGRQDRGELWAVLLAGARGQQRSNRVLQRRLGPRQESVRMVGRYSQRRRELRAGQLMPQGEFEHLAVFVVEAAE